MRRSGAPSVRNAQKRKVEHTNSFDNKQCNENEEKTLVDLTKCLKGDKVAFNVVWREQTTKKHKFWKGNGILEVHSNTKRAVLLDDAGKYLASTDKYEIPATIGLQMRIGSKEIELLEQIVDQNEYWMARKMQMENRDWGSEEWTPPEETTKPVKALARMSVPKLIFNSKLPCKALKEHTLSLPLSTQLEKSEHCVKNLKISEALGDVLRTHQREGVVFLYECLMGYKQKGDYHGCILADEMGLGKTLQVLTVANSLLRYCSPLLHRVLIVTPRTLIANWNNEICKWLERERMFGFVVDGNNVHHNRRKISSYSKQLHMPFVIVSYETLVSQAQDFQALNFDLLICDEGHRLKNATTKTYQTLRGMNIKYCVVLTGTPVQNVLGEFFALADFVNPGIFGSQSEFRNYFEVPIERGQSSVATLEEKCLADERTTELRNITSTFLLRRLQNVNVKHLPKKQEYICFLCPSRIQHMLLRKVLSYYEGKKETISAETTPLELISLLRKICNHPYLIKHSKEDNSLVRYLGHHIRDLHQINASDSSKLSLVQNLLQTTVRLNLEKIVLVSYHTKTLDVLQKLCVQLNLKYLRLDGSTSTAERNQIVTKFNAPNSKFDFDAFVLLLSAKAGGVGLNLIGASRLVLYDIDWNPANDAQALSRIWREGQQRDVHIYRLITAGCIEEKIFQRQIFKTNLGEFLTPKENTSTNTVTSMKFSDEELKDLFQLQYDYNFCDTHQILNCNCLGNGQNLTMVNESSTDTKQFNELNRWKHWKPNTDEAFMKEACLLDVKDELIYIFSNKTQ